MIEDLQNTDTRVKLINIDMTECSVVFCRLVVWLFSGIQKALLKKGASLSGDGQSVDVITS